MSSAPVHCDVVVVGAGFGGMYALQRLRDGLGLDTVVVERGDDVGGTWYWNRYPGARCDGEAIFYSYSFDPDLQDSWTWSERFSTQPEILSYARHVADRYDLRRSIRFGTEVTAADFDESEHTWAVQTSTGTIVARYLVTAVGCLSASRIPPIAGIDGFAGEIHHSSRWPHDGVDLTGKRVALIGTGSTGIQMLPIIAAQCAHVTVFQRTPNFSVPARNRALGPDEIARVRAVYPTLRELSRASGFGQFLAPPAGSALDDRRNVERELDRRWAEGGVGILGAFTDLLTDQGANDVVADYVRTRIKEIVDDPGTAALLCPTDYPIATKRICVDSNYFATFNRDNVDLVDISTAPITQIVPEGLVVDGQVHQVDVIAFATGFDALTGAFTAIDIQGRNGAKLKDLWEAGPRSYLGIAVNGFPNMFMITGPGSPSVLSNMINSIEQHVEWITNYIAFLTAAGITSTEPTMTAQDEWVQEVNDVAAATLYPKGKSWYLGANIPGKPRVFMPYAGGVGTYRQQCDLIAAKGYAGFRHTAAPTPNHTPEPPDNAHQPAPNDLEATTAQL